MDNFGIFAYVVNILEDAGLDLNDAFELFVSGVASIALTKAELNPRDYSKKDAESIANDLHDEILKTTMRFINRIKEKECT